jgi:hypothetical protein
MFVSALLAERDPVQKIDLSMPTPLKVELLLLIVVAQRV